LNGAAAVYLGRGIRPSKRAIYHSVRTIADVVTGGKRKKERERERKERESVGRQARSDVYT
jgi:hypothetical protein